MCQLPTSANMPETRGRKEMASYANVMARLDEKMSKGQQIKIMMDVFGYTQSAASQYLIRNNIKCSGRDRAFSVYDVEKYLWADMSKSEKINTIKEKLNVDYYTAWYFISKHPDCGRKAKPEPEPKPIEQVIEDKVEVEQVEEKLDVQKVESIAERPSDTKATVIADIKRTISEIEKLEEELESKKRLLKSMMYGYINLD